MSFDSMAVNDGAGASSAGSPPAEAEGMPRADEISSWLRENGADLWSSEGAEASSGAGAAATDDSAWTNATGALAEDASSGGTAAGEERSPFIPRERFDEVNSRLKETSTRLQELESLATYSPVFQRFQAMGLTTEQILSMMDQPPAAAAAEAPTPALSSQPAPSSAPENGSDFGDSASETAALEEFCTANGIDDPFLLEPNVYTAVRTAFLAQQATQRQVHELRQAMESQLSPVRETVEQVRAWEAELARQQQIAQEQAQLAEWRGELAALSERFPVFQDQENLADLVARWNQSPEGTTLTETAERMYQRWGQIGNVAARNQLAESALLEAAAARQRPAMAGGSPPSPARVIDYSALSLQEMQQLTTAALRAARTAGQ